MDEEKKKTTFLFVFSTYLPLFLLKFRLGELVGCGINFRIKRIPALHTFDGPRYPKNKKYLKKRDDDKPHYPKNKKYLKKRDDDIPWMRNQIPHPTSSLNRNLSKNTGRYVEYTNKKNSFFLFFLQN